ncbi:hypothetical protein PTKIN_Ptkin12aG0149300 [Pterospermum kingtungense]
MATETEKRSEVCNGELVEEQEDDDEQKMEQFFALIKNFQEARNKRKNELRIQSDEKINKNKIKQKKIRRLDHELEQSTTWVPTFEWADFTEEVEFRTPPIIFPSPYNNKEDKKQEQEDDGGLDLKLTL